MRNFSAVPGQSPDTSYGRRRKRRLGAFAAAAVLAALFVSGSGAADPQLVGTVGPGFTIDLLDASGAHVTHLDPGTYSLTVHDRADIHNFHLMGPGVDVSTDVDFVGDKTFTVTFAEGWYSYFCDPHSDSMLGEFPVGNPPPKPTPKPAPRKTATFRLGPGRSLAVPAKLAGGAYTLTVRDLSKTDNVHLSGPGVNRRTGVAFRGTVRWNVTLSTGRYRVWSDAHRKLARTIVVS
jgi:plastocyanin